MTAFKRTIIKPTESLAKLQVIWSRRHFLKLRNATKESKKRPLELHISSKLFRKIDLLNGIVTFNHVNDPFTYWWFYMFSKCLWILVDLFVCVCVPWHTFNASGLKRNYVLIAITAVSFKTSRNAVVTIYNGGAQHQMLYTSAMEDFCKPIGRVTTPNKICVVFQLHCCSFFVFPFSEFFVSMVYVFPLLLLLFCSFSHLSLSLHWKLI